MTPFSFCLVAAERMTIFVQSRRYWRPPNKSAHLSDDIFCIPQKKPTDNIQIVRPLAPTTKTVAPHINLCESAHKNKKSKHNNQPNASSRSRCRRPYPRRGQPMLGRHQPPMEAQKKVNIYRAYCLFHFIIFILHHPNVVLCRYHRRRIDSRCRRPTHDEEK